MRPRWSLVPATAALRLVGSSRTTTRGVTATYREVSALDVGEAEAEAEAEALAQRVLRLLVERGLTGVQLVVSDAHAPEGAVRGASPPTFVVGLA
jgi:Transposase, Mutator family